MSRLLQPAENATERAVRQRVAVVYASLHHGNTRRIAAALATELSADLVPVADVQTMDLASYDLVGIGSGIYFGRHHESILCFAESLIRPHSRVFVFSTAGLPWLWKFQHAALRRLLEGKGCLLVGEFCCPGWDTYGPLRLIGGIYRRRPHERDLARARRFAQEMGSLRQPQPISASGLS